MRTVVETLELVLAQIPKLAFEIVPIRDARGRILAQDLVATRALPAFDNSAMDGYAARSADLPGMVQVMGTAAAGEVHAGEVDAGCAVRIFTGAVVPPGVDTVVIQEDAKVDGDRVVLPASPVGENIRRAGEDIAMGETVLVAGARIGPAELGMLAALGVIDVPVARAPRVAVIATGDELVDAATVPGPGQLVDSSAHAVTAMIRDAGGVPQSFGIARDDPMTLAALIASALDHDVVITTGGVSVGDRDFVRAALASAGVTLEAHKVAMKPGKPFSFGMNGETAVFGLPGNPVSTFVAFELFVRPALLAMQGATNSGRPRAPVSLVRGYRKPAGRAHFIRARVVRNGEHLVAHPHLKQGSAMLSSLIGCNALVELPADATEILPNSTQQAVLLEPV
jgi:molybdopterin molybdotransferase